MTKSKAEIAEERRANLPLPEDPPEGEGFNTADASGVRIGSGKIEDNPTNLIGREGKEGLSGPPNDAVTRDAKHKKGLSKTTNEDVKA